MSLYFEKLENKIVLSSFGYYKSKSHKVENHHDVAAVVANIKSQDTPQVKNIQDTTAVIFRSNTSPSFVCSITPEGNIQCKGAARTPEVHAIYAT
jgi:hypothetical protein